MDTAKHNAPRDPLAERLRLLPESAAPARVAARVLAEVEARQALDVKLRALPLVPAPDSLAPEVLAAIARMQRRAWWQQSWFCWPASVRAATAALAVAVLALGSWLGLEGWQAATANSADAAGWFAQSTVGELLAVLARTLSALARSDYALVVFTTGMLVSTMYVGALTLGTVCWRLARPRR